MPSPVSEHHRNLNQPWDRPERIWWYRAGVKGLLLAKGPQTRVPSAVAEDREIQETARHCALSLLNSEQYTRKEF